MDKTVLDTIFANHPLKAEAQSVTITADELVHVVGAQEPIREQPDDRARMLLALRWLTIETISVTLSEAERPDLVATVQQAARNWIKQDSKKNDPTEREQVRWVFEKTRSHESKQQIAQRVWLALVLYGLDYRGIRFDSEGQIHWDSGTVGRIGLSPDAALDLAWSQPARQVYVSSFRQPDGAITRGKGRHRWHVYRLTVSADAAFLFERRTTIEQQRVALIVASETFATLPLLPRDFYGGDEFQQACIDAQDQQFAEILVLSPQHGVISLDDTVPSEREWDEVIERNLWSWQLTAAQRLGGYLFGARPANLPKVAKGQDYNWWVWLNPASSYEFTVFGGGFPVRILFDHLLRARTRLPESWPRVVLVDERDGYDIGDFDDDFDFDFDEDDEFEDDEDDVQNIMQDIDQLLDWAGEFVTLVSVYVPPTGETWELAPDEAIIPTRLLTETGMDIEDLLDLLMDISLLLNQPIPFALLVNAPMLVSVLLQITHSLVHDERDAIPDLLDVFQDGVIRQYIESVMQETSLEDRLCGVLTLTEQVQLLAISIPRDVSEQLLVWLQTHIALRLRQRIMGA
ncbi:MAG TPA: hypothetical protein VHP83_23205, partial [Aggregatilineaceae bacterium]|nr:hypothetical protein [Aggregatilineaceae bacterium]